MGERHPTARVVVRGTGAGLVATGAMSAWMLAAQKVGAMGKMPPKKITQFALDRLHFRRSEPADNIWSTVAHFAYGAGCGGVFAWLGPRTARGVSAPLKGAAFATLVWFVSYFGWIPALGVLPRPDRDRRRGRSTSMLTAHWIFGGILGVVVSSGRPAERRLSSAG